MSGPTGAVTISTVSRMPASYQDPAKGNTAQTSRAGPLGGQLVHTEPGSISGALCAPSPLASSEAGTIIAALAATEEETGALRA